MCRYLMKGLSYCGCDTKMIFSAWHQGYRFIFDNSIIGPGKLGECEIEVSDFGIIEIKIHDSCSEEERV
jgi:hypothetical protein